MPTFRFRAAAALEVRRRQEDDSLAICLRKDAEKHVADQRCVEVADKRKAASSELIEAQNRSDDFATLTWHRNWITGLSAAADAAAADAAKAAEACNAARQVWQEARKKRLVLERLRERAWKRFLKDEARREQQALDELARVRFTTRAAAEESVQ